MAREGFNLARWGIEHPSLLVYLIITILLGGGAAYFQLGQRDLPVYAIKTMVISAQWPGASAEEMSQFVTDPLETKLLEVPWLKDVTSFSKPGETFLLVNIEDFMPDGASRMRDRYYDIRKKVDDMVHLLPAGVQGPLFNDEFGDIYSILYSFNSQDYTPSEIKDWVEQARNAVVRIDEVEKAVLYGAQPEKVFVELDDKRLAELQLDPLRVASVLQGHNRMRNSGRVEGSARYYQLRLNDRFHSLSDVAATPIKLNDGSVIRLDDVARVYRGYQDPPRFTMRVNGEPAIGLAITMREGSQLLTLSSKVNEVMEEFRQRLPAAIEMSLVADQPASVRASINKFLVKLALAILIVLLVSNFSLGLRTGLVVALAIPLVLGIVFVAMYIWGINITRISLGALVIALGLLVDDAMIVVELMHVKLEQGWDRLKAATFAYAATSMPMLSGTLIAAAGFMPVFVVDASPKEILGDLFVVISIALVASWVVAVLFTPFLAYRLLKPVDHSTDHAANLSASHPSAHAGDLYQTAVYQHFRTLVRWCMLHRWRVILLSLTAFLLTLIGLQQVAVEFFPDNDRPEVLVDVWFPEETSYREMERQVQRIEQQLAAAPEAQHYITYIGGDTLRVQNDMFVEQPNANYTKVIAIADNLADREQLKIKLKGFFENHLPELRTRVYNLPYGMPFAYPVQYRVTGENPQQLDRIVDELKQIVASHPDISDVHDNRREPILTVSIDLDLPRVAAAGLEPERISLALSSMLDGVPVTRLREDNDLIEVVLRNSAKQRYNLDQLGDLLLTSVNGTAIPLAKLARLNYRFEEGVVRRYNGFSSVTVLGLLPEGVQTLEVNQQLLPELNRLRQTLPSGYAIEAGGQVEVSAIVDSQLAKTLPLLLFTLLTILMLQLNSISKMVLVLATVPLGLLGVVAALLAFELPFGLVARLGVLALSGIIVRNTIILIDQIDQDLAAGATVWDAVLESTVRRARPIVLTALAAILALIPLANDYFWGPMAVAMMSGLLVATALTLLVFPALYCAWFKVKPAAF